MLSLVSSWIDFYFLWSYHRRLFQNIILKIILRVTKWVLHLVTGKSELRRLLEFNVHYWKLSNAWRTIKIEEICRFSNQIDFNFERRMDHNKLARKISVIKLIPIKRYTSLVIQLY